MLNFQKGDEHETISHSVSLCYYKYNIKKRVMNIEKAKVYYLNIVMRELSCLQYPTGVNCRSDKSGSFNCRREGIRGGRSYCISGWRHNVSFATGAGGSH